MALLIKNFDVIFLKFSFLTRRVFFYFTTYFDFNQLLSNIKFNFFDIRIRFVLPFFLDVQPRGLLLVHVAFVIFYLIFALSLKKPEISKASTVIFRGKTVVCQNIPLCQKFPHSKSST